MPSFLNMSFLIGLLVGWLALPALLGLVKGVSGKASPA